MKIYDLLEAPVPKPLDNDIEDAIEHADTEGNGWDRTDFHLEKMLDLILNEVYEYARSTTNQCKSNYGFVFEIYYARLSQGW